MKTKYRFGLVLLACAALVACDDSADDGGAGGSGGQMTDAATGGSGGSGAEGGSGGMGGAGAEGGAGGAEEDAGNPETDSMVADVGIEADANDIDGSIDDQDRPMAARYRMRAWSMRL